MAYREVTMVEVKEVLRLWVARMGTKRIAAYLGLDRKTVRRYIAAGNAQGVRREQGEGALSEEVVLGVLAQCRRRAARPHGVGWSCCEAQREFIARHLANGVRLSKIRKLLRRRGVEVPYATLRRWAVATLGFGRTASTLPVADGAPGQECQLDTGWVLQLAPDGQGKCRRLRAWIFTAVVSRHRFVWPIEHETTASAIEACEMAWEFFAGIFAVLIPDNTRAIVQRADALEPVINPTFMEYAQARGFHVDPARVRKARDKARVERAVPTVREDCFAGEELLSIDDAREHARRWCLEDYGLRRHTSTQRLPREHFESEERAQLLPAPSTAYEIPLWAEPKVARDQHVQVAKALYSLPREFLGKRLRARADRSLVRLYDRGVLVKTHPRQPPGKRSTDPADFPEEKRAYAMRDIHYLHHQAAAHGAMIGAFAARLLEDPLPWTRMRRVYALLGLVRKYGAGRVEQSCATALAAEMLSVRRLQRMMALALPPSSSPPGPISVAPARYLRPSTQYALALGSSTVEGADGH
jgi:transposase